MKKIFLAIALSGIFYAAQSQTEKGDWMVGGEFRLNTSDNNTEIGLTPTAGLFIIKNLAIGANVTISYSKNGTRKTTDLGLGPFVRYYFTDAKIRPILQGSLSFISEKTKIGDVSNTNNKVDYFLGGGAAIFISEQVSIDGLMGYYHSKVDGFDGGGGFALNIGFQVYLFKKQMDKVRGK
jgi:outer membrane protein